MSSPTVIRADYRVIPWFDRGIEAGDTGPVVDTLTGVEYENLIGLYMDDKAGEKPYWRFATGLVKNGKLALSAEPGHEEELEWYRRKVRKWVAAHPGQKCWGDFFGTFVWSETNPDASRFVEYDVLCD